METARLLQASLGECQQAAQDKQDQVSRLSQELSTAQGNAASLAKVHARAEEQLQQQAAMLQQVTWALMLFQTAFFAGMLAITCVHCHVSAMCPEQACWYNVMTATCPHADGSDAGQ